MSEAIDHITRIASGTRREVEILLAPARRWPARETSYGRIEGSRSVNQLIDRVVDEISEATAGDEEPDSNEAQLRAQDAGVVNLVNQIIAQAIQERPTDIHIEPLMSGLVIRCRLDGLLYDALSLPGAVYTGVISRVKILANMDIAERRAARRTGASRIPRAGVTSTSVSPASRRSMARSLSCVCSTRPVRFLARPGLVAGRLPGVPPGHPPPLRHDPGVGPTGSGKSTTSYAGLLERCATTP